MMRDIAAGPLMALSTTQRAQQWLFQLFMTFSLLIGLTLDQKNVLF